MNKRSIIIAIVGIIILVIVFKNMKSKNLNSYSSGEQIGFLDKEQENSTSKDGTVENFVKEIDLQEIKNTLLKLENLTDAKVLEESEIKRKYKIETLENIEVLSLLNDETENYTEVGIIKLSSEEQVDKIMQSFLTRHFELSSMENNASTVIQNNTNVIMKQQAGVGIFILSANSSKIEQEIDKFF